MRVRGKNNNTIEGRGNLLMSIEEEQKIIERKKQLKKSNDRFRMIESIERERKGRMEQEILKLQ